MTTVSLIRSHTFWSIYLLILASIMPRKERLRKEKERDLQQAAQGSSSLLSWMKAKENEDERSESRAESGSILMF